MQFVLTEIVARAIALYLLIDVSRTLWQELAERKASALYYDAADWALYRFFNVAEWVAHRDSAPVRYWFYIAGHVFLLVIYLVVAIFGWYVPKT